MNQRHYKCRYCHRIIRDSKYKRPEIKVVGKLAIRTAVCFRPKCLMLDIQSIYKKNENK